jgi:hypothetical protein
MRFPRFVSFLICITLNTFSLFAQSPDGNINGLVSDPSSAAVVGAEIVAVNDVTGGQYTTRTNTDGIYVLPNLPPGPYRVQVSKIGFKTLIKPDIVLNVQDSLSINFTLVVGAFHEIVTVEGGAPILNTQSPSVSTVIDQNFVESLPLNGRSFNTLLQLTPGVTIAPANLSSPGQFSVAGQRTDANSFSIDGVSANFGVQANASGFPGESGTGSAQAFSAVGGTSTLVSVEALQEFRVETSSFAPEFGKTPGGQVILTTRGGTNALHGGVYEYFRNNVLDANDWFANNAGLPRAPEQHNDFGGFLGGPIRKDKAFFFLSYEGARLRLPRTEVIDVPSLYARSVATAAVAPFVDAYPKPSDGTVAPGVYTSSFTGDFSNTASLNAVSLRVDTRISDRLSLFGRYDYAPSNFDQRLNSLNTTQTTTSNVQTFTLGANTLIRPTLLNEIRFNFSAQTSNALSGLDSFGGAVPPSSALLLGTLGSSNNSGGFYSFDVGFYSQGPIVRDQTHQFEVANDLTLSAVSHQLKFGADYRAIFLDNQPFQHSITYETPNLETLLTTGAVSIDSVTSNPAQFLTQSVSIYAQDSWKAGSRLVLTYGVRWELAPAPSARGATELASWSNVNTPQDISLAPAGSPLWKTSYTNFAPRFGLAYRLMENGNFVARTGGGVFYDLGVGSAANVGSYFPNSATDTYNTVPLPVSDLAQYIPAISRTPPYSSVWAFDPKLELPRSYEWNFALEKSFLNKQSVSATYVGQSGRKLLRQEALWMPNSNFAGDYLLSKNDASSSYNALQMQYRRPLSGRLQAIVNYTWSHSLDNASNDVVAGLADTVISGARDHASSDFDVRHLLSAAVTYEIPSLASHFLRGVTGHWEIDAVVLARSGFPFNASVFGVSPDPGGYALTRPNLVPGQPLWLPDSIAPGGKTLNANAFAVPTMIEQGTEGRNDIPGFGLTQVDLSLGRKMRLRDNFSLQFRADAFNVLNHPNFTNPYGYIQFGPTYLASTEMLNQGLGGLNPLFQQGGPRSLQLSLKLTF